MKLLLTKNISTSSQELMRSLDWKVDVLETLKITPVTVSHVPEDADVWIVSSRNSLAAVEKFKDQAPYNIYVVGKWMEQKLSDILFKSDIKAFENMTLLAAALSTQTFSKAIYFCADNHRPELEQTLASQAEKLTKIVTHESKLTYPLLKEKYDAIMIFSPRSVESLLKNNSFDLSTIFATIGPTTINYLHKNNITNTFCASYPDSDILVKEFADVVGNRQPEHLNT